ncbi:aldo/keto reductase [Streptomyces avicenniae]|uniref:aldo/keto reductase n=1 Tax=Streptomyces avicenniae TaxID=500153 RepID=UPI000699AEA9|nr:aldo/keto reductase [Streptomyces avicenniae]
MTSPSPGPSHSPAPLPSRTLGAHGPAVSALGLGCMGMSALYAGGPGPAESVATLHAALDAGVTLLDTGDFYDMGGNEMLIGEALRGVSPSTREQVLLSVKFGALRDPDGGFAGFDGRPVAVRNALLYSLRRLGVDHVDVYRLARLDPAVPIEETVGAVAELVRAGLVRHVGLSEVGAATVRRAAAVTPIADLQIEYSLLSRGIEREILPTLRELGIGVTAYGVLSRGLISGHWRADRRLDAADFRRTSPRFAGDNLTHNLRLVEALRAVADERGVSVAQLAIAWVLAQGEDIVPLVGARTRERLAESLGALSVALGPEDLAAVEAAVPPGAAAGARYAPGQTAFLDGQG